MKMLSLMKGNVWDSEFFPSLVKMYIKEKGDNVGKKKLALSSRSISLVSVGEPRTGHSIPAVASPYIQNG